MSRVGQKPIEIPAEVTIKIEDGRIAVSGPKGNLSLRIRPEIKVELKEGKILVTRQGNGRISRSLHGLTRSLIANAIWGVTKGFAKTLKIVGVGYRASMEGESLILSVGFSHPIKIAPPSGIKFEIEGNDKIKVLGVDKQLVGEIAAQIRRVRPPDVYKGKGIRYEDEEVKLKPGKAGKTGAAGAAGTGGGK